ncbi:MAG: DUF4234 domain-containing protein [Kineosporiaceae bacterium]|nr:DUF4234 domain-containing protein [Aeromicrobium sp.]
MTTDSTTADPNAQIPAYAGFPVAGPLGKVRGTGVCILLAFVTLGIYPIVWYFQTHTEMKRHSNNGIGGGVALLLSIFIGIVMPYLTSSEVGNLYRNKGMNTPVSGATGLWYFPGMFIVVGPLVWFIKTNGALNGYWRSQGAN